MALNPNIILQGQSPQLTQPNPIDQYSKAMQLKGLLTQNQIQQQSLSDDQSQRQALSESGGDQSAYLKALSTSGNYKAYQATLKAQQDQQKTLADIGKTQAETKHREKETQNLGISQYRDAVTNVNSPQDAIALITQQNKDGLLPGGEQQYQGAIQAIQQAGQDPMLFDQWKKQYALGATKFIETNKPTYQTSNLGNRSVTTALPGLGGAPTVVNSQAIGVSPDAALSAATTRRGQDLVDARTPRGQVVNTDQGIMLVDPKSGQAHPVISNGQPLQPKLKDLPAPIQKSLMENGAAVRKIDAALNAVKEYPQGLGVSNYLGDEIRQRSDPKGVNVRALVADIGSLKIHDRSGAAVTASETPRLKPFIPTATDNSETVAKKLNLFRQEYAAINDDIKQTYTKDMGFNARMPAETPSSTPILIKTAEDYAKLQSGSTYVDPSGQTRRKP